MPLHLLGKKSWNVYNTANIEKVRRDEAAAAAREAGEEQRMQEEDAHQRLLILRGETTKASFGVRPTSTKPLEAGSRSGHERKRKRMAGEDDTDRDIRWALERTADSSTATAPVPCPPKPSSNAPLLDTAGHINLFPPEKIKHSTSKNTEAEAEAAKTKREYEDQYTMRFSNAAGFKQSLDAKPWYFDAGSARQEKREPSPGISEYEKLRAQRKAEKAQLHLSAEDPLSAMKQGVQGLRDVERSRHVAKEQRKQELVSINEDLRRRKRHRDADLLDDFHLDHTSAAEDRLAKHHGRHRSSSLRDEQKRRRRRGLSSHGRDR